MKEMKQRLRKEITDSFDYSGEITEEELFGKIDQVIMKEAKTNFLTLEKKEQLRRELYASIRGLDILEELLAQEEITEIMINGPDRIFVEKEGRLEKTGKTFESRDKLEDVIQQIAAGANRVVNESNPILDATLKDGSRVNVILSPVALEGPAVTIRKFTKEPFTMEQLVKKGAISAEAADFLGSLV